MRHIFNVGDVVQHLATGHFGTVLETLGDKAVEVGFSDYNGVDNSASQTWLVNGCVHYRDTVMRILEGGPMRKLIYPHCGKDISLTGHQVTLDGGAIQNGGCFPVGWREDCPDCGGSVVVDLVVGPIEASIRKAVVQPHA